MGQLLELPAEIGVEPCPRLREEAKPFEHLDTQSATGINQSSDE